MRGGELLEVKLDYKSLLQGMGAPSSSAALQHTVKQMEQGRWEGASPHTNPLSPTLPGQRERVTAAEYFCPHAGTEAAQDFGGGHGRAGPAASWPGPGRSCARCRERRGHCCWGCRAEPGEGLTLPEAPSSFCKHGKQRLRFQLECSVKYRGSIEATWLPSAHVRAAGSYALLCDPYPFHWQQHPVKGSDPPKQAGQEPISKLGELPRRRARPVG